jgi:hypothetical protein
MFATPAEALIAACTRVTFEGDPVLVVLTLDFLRTISVPWLEHLDSILPPAWPMIILDRGNHHSIEAAVRHVPWSQLSVVTPETDATLPGEGTRPIILAGCAIYEETIGRFLNDASIWEAMETAGGRLRTHCFFLTNTVVLNSTTARGILEEATSPDAADVTVQLASTPTSMKNVRTVCRALGAPGIGHTVPERLESDFAGLPDFRAAAALHEAIAPTFVARISTVLKVLRSLNFVLPFYHAIALAGPLIGVTINGSFTMLAADTKRFEAATWAYPLASIDSEHFRAACDSGFDVAQPLVLSALTDELPSDLRGTFWETLLADLEYE